MSRLVHVLLLILLLTGCTTTLSSTPPAPEVVVLWHEFADETEAALQVVGDRFNATHPQGPHLVVERQEDLLEKLETLSEARHPDLIVVNGDKISDFRDAGVVTELATLPREVEDDLLPMAIASYGDPARPWGVPLGLATYVLYYNQDWLQDLDYDPAMIGVTELQTTACEATNIQGGQVGLALPARAGTLLALLTASAAPIQERVDTYQLNDATAISTAELLHEALRQGCGRIHELTESGVRQFGSSTMALLVGSSLERDTVLAAVEDSRNFTVGLTALPGQSSEVGTTLWYGPGLLLTASEGPRREAAWSVLRWFLSRDAQMLWTRRTDYLPVRRSHAENALEATTDPLESTLLEITLRAAEENRWRSWPTAASETSCRAALIRGLYALNTEQPISEVLTDAQEACDPGGPP